MVDAAARLQQAVQFVEVGRLTEADAICREILDLDTQNAAATFLRGLIAFQRGQPTHALDLLRVAASLDPDNANYQATFGAVLAEHGDAAEAIAAFEQAASIDPGDFQSLRHLAKKYRQVGRMADAISAYERIHAQSPLDIADLLALGTLLQTEKGPAAAVETFEKAVTFAPDNVLARNHLAACLQLCGRITETITSYRESLALQPKENSAAVGLFAAMQTVCDWRDFDSLSAQVDDMTGAALAAGASPVEDPFLNITHSTDPKRNYDVAQSWSTEQSRRVAAWGVSFGYGARNRGQIRVGYLSTDFHDHATAHLMVGLFGAHDRSNVTVHAYSCGPDDGSDFRRRIQADCDSFIDIAAMDAIAAARRIHDDGIDILVDLKGYTRQNRLDIAAMRPAPVQVAWLGFPGTSGAEFFDYILTDDIVTPPDTAGAYSEAFAVLPHCYQVNNREQIIADTSISRAEVGLPEDALVLASFNNTYKLEPVMFAAWMALLRDIPGSVLWLLPNNSLAVENFRREASDAGVAPERLKFADLLPKEQHLNRAGLADLALDTRIYNGHTTTSDMLWAGVPVVTLKGIHFASRVSASLLTAFGLPELITETLDSYKILVCDLARSPDRIASMRAKTARLRLQSPLFDTRRFARDLERSYEEMWRRYENGEAPKRFAVSELD